MQQSGPFLTVPVAERVWPTGLSAVAPQVRARLRAAVNAMLADPGTSRTAASGLVLVDALGWGDALIGGADLPAALGVVVAEHGVVLRPDFAFRAEPEDPIDATDEDLGYLNGEEDQPDAEEDESDAGTLRAPTPVSESQWRALGMWAPWGSHPLIRRIENGWAASPVERMAALLRARDIPIGVVSDGRWWALVWAPPGKPVGAGVWDAGLWSEEPESLEAFVALLERRRFLGVQPADRLPALLEESASAQEEVTTTLGVQVRMAVEMLVRRLDELDRQAGGTLLKEVSDDDLYAGVVTVMMRLVFLLFAEERRLLPSDDAHYDTSYSAGRLVEQLEQRAALHGEQTLEHRTGAWHRLLALARALHGGVAHEDLRLPPYGGGLFDPDRYRWLEGLDGKPPPVDDLTVLRMLEAVQYVHLRGERRRLTFRSLDVEQIGYVYEGLLELEVRTAVEPILALRRQGRKSLTLISVHDALEAMDDLETWTATTYTGEKKVTPARRKRAARWLAEQVSPATLAGLRLALGTDLANRLQPLGPLLARDDRDRPVITPGGGRYVAPSTRRSATGAHYTPRSLAEEVVQHSLEPLCYRPGPLETLARERWVLRPSTDLLALRVADVAMGSGAFLVAACRFLADRVVEAWDTEGDTEATAALGRRGPQTSDTEIEGVLLRARRLVAEHCLYGVDINPLAVEMAKLSLWLVTMDRERPFGFLDDRLVCGDSLLGVVSLSQLEEIHLDPEGARRRRAGAFDFGIGSREMLARAADTRRRITATPVTTVRDVEHKTRLLHEAERASAPLLVIADALTGAGLMAAALSPGHRNSVFARLEDAFRVVESGKDPHALEPYTAAINAGLPEGKEPRRPLHWPLAFPEVFADTAVPGFDTIVGNPPFLGGKKISGALGGDYLSWLAAWDGRGVKGNTDLAARFLLRADSLLGPRGQLGYVATNTLIEGDTLAVGLLQLEGRGWTVRKGTSAHHWPSASANLSIVEIWTTKAPLKAEAVLDDEPVPHLSIDLQPYLQEIGRPDRLSENVGVAFQGSNVLGVGFTLTPAEAMVLLAEEPHNADVLFPYVIGADLNRRPDTSASRWIINFHNWALEHAELYPVLLERVRRLVKPERDRLPDYKKRVREAWWRYEHQAPTLNEAIAGLDNVLAISLVGNALLPVRVSTGQVYDHACGVFALDDFASLAVLSSSAHQAWVIRYTSTLETRIRYAPSDVFLTFPRPVPTPKLHDLGKSLDTERRELMLSRALGLTKLYNQVHDPTVIDPAILRLRELHLEIDRAVLAAYGWEDLDPQIGHHRTKIGTRWTVSPQARFQLLDRLLVENHRRAEGT
jgi:hypothetical protein